ncbi:MAG: hypothetical protein AB2L12_07675 [Smithellaceae bacterium]
MKKQKNETNEPLGTGPVHFKLKANEADVDRLNEMHGRHMQKGHDVLTISTPDCNLNFRTTFTPGPGDGQDLCCIIAGEIITLKELSFTPEEWRAFTDRLTTRNNKLKKMAAEKHRTIQPFVEATSQWERVSSVLREEFKKTNDPLVVVRFLKDDPFALRAAWVQREVEQWLHRGRYDLLDLVFSRQKGHRKDEHDNQVKDFLLVLKVDKMVSKGFTKEKAFENVTEFMGRHRSINAVKKAYYRCIKQMYKQFFFETPDSYVLEVRNTKVSFFDEKGEEHFIFTNWSYTLPK